MDYNIIGIRENPDIRNKQYNIFLNAGALMRGFTETVLLIV